MDRLARRSVQRGRLILASVAQLTEWRDRLFAGLADPSRSVRDSSGEEITYRSVREMIAAINAIDTAIANQQRGMSRYSYPTFDKGL